jgi:hypothetical protein
MKKIKIQPFAPLSPLNSLFPEGVPVDGEMLVNSNPVYLFDTDGVSQDTLREIVKIISSDEMPFAIFAVLQAQAELVIPKEWVCTDEQSITASS